MKYIVRVIALPFVAGICLTYALSKALHVICLFMINGGEWASYKDEDRKTIYDLYQQLKNQNS